MYPRLSAQCWRKWTSYKLFDLALTYIYSWNPANLIVIHYLLLHFHFRQLMPHYNESIPSRHCISNSLSLWVRNVGFATHEAGTVVVEGRNDWTSDPVHSCFIQLCQLRDTVCVLLALLSRLLIFAWESATGGWCCCWVLCTLPGLVVVGSSWCASLD